MPPERLSREEKKARTRERLLDAASRVFARDGFLAATLDEVSEEAGLTKGAIYSNFQSKEDLFLALLDRHLNQPAMQVPEQVDPAQTLEAQAEQSARLFMDLLEKEREWYLLDLEAATYAARNPEFHAKFWGQYRNWRGTVAKMIEERAQTLGVELPLSPEEMAIAFNAMGRGIFIERLADPEGVP
jgi:AcrR family transcriptional regulator